MQHTTIYEKSCYHKCRKLVTNTTINYVNLTIWYRSENTKVKNYKNILMADCTQSKIILY